MNETPTPPIDPNKKSLAEEISEPKATVEHSGIASEPVEPAKPEVPLEVQLACSRFRKGEYVPLKGVWFEVIGFVDGRMVLYPMGWTAKEMKRWKG